MSDNSPEDIGAPAEAGGWSGGLRRPPGDVTRCPSCRRRIRFVKMADGSSMPVEADPEQVVVVRREMQAQKSLFGTDATPAIAGHMTQAWRPHWAQCNEPNRWRKPR